MELPRKKRSFRPGTCPTNCHPAPDDYEFIKLNSSSNPSQSDSTHGTSYTTYKSRDTPPPSNDQPIRKENRTKTSSEASQNTVAEVAVFLLFVVMGLYLVSCLFSTETKVNQNVKIVLQSGSEEEASKALEEMLQQILRQLKQELETKVRVEIQAGEGDAAGSSMLWSAIKLFFLLFVIMMVVFPNIPR